MAKLALRKRDKPRITRRQMLDSRPVRNQALSYQHNDNGEVIITIPRRTDAWGKILSVVLVMPKERHLVLDQVGAAVWDLCDGEHTVAQMVDALRRQQKLNTKEAEVALTDYLRQLGKRRLVGFVVLRNEQTGNEERTSGSGQRANQ